MTPKKFDPGDLKVLGPSPSATQLASLLGLDNEYLRALRQAASPFKWSAKNNLGDVGKALLQAIKANRALSPSKREDERSRIVGEARSEAKAEHVRKRHEARQWIEMVRIFEGQANRINKLSQAAQAKEAHAIRDAYYGKKVAKLAKYAEHEAREKAHAKEVKAQRRAQGLAQVREAQQHRELYDESKPFMTGSYATFNYSRGYSASKQKRWPNIPASVLTPEKHFQQVMDDINANQAAIAKREAKGKAPTPFQQKGGKVAQYQYIKDQNVQVTNSKPKLNSGD